MRLFAMEHSKAAYGADFALYLLAVVFLAAWLAWAGPHALRIDMAVFVLLGLVTWTLVEYAIHRFVLHGLLPFSRWHGEHHDRPMALICAPTVLSASLIATLIFLPVFLFGDVWLASSLTLGLVAGYLAYAVTHHATHHWRAENAWLRQRKRWHALHHHAEAGCYGVTSSFWDHVFGTAAPRRSPQGPRAQ